MDIEIIGSYYGAMSRIANPTTHISVIGEDGAIIRNEWAEMCRRTADNGATGLREMPFWLEKQEDHIFAPYIYELGTFNLDRFNPLYFENLRRMAEIANRYNLKFYLSLYEHCNTKARNNLRAFVPWTNNRQQLSDGFYGQDADRYRRTWESKVFETLSGLDVGYELCNEPDGDFTRLLLMTYQHAAEAGIQDEHIVPGVNFCLDNAGNKPYRQFKTLLKNTYGVPWYEKQKHIWFTAIHNLSQWDWKELEKQKGHTRRFWLSVDGHHPKPSRDWWKAHLKVLLEALDRTPFKNRYAFETMHKCEEDDFDDTRGVSQALFEVTGQYPPNYNKFPAGEPVTLPPENPGDVIQQRITDMEARVEAFQVELIELRRQVEQIIS